MNTTTEEMYNLVQRAGISLTAFQDWFNKAVELNSGLDFQEGYSDGLQDGYSEGRSEGYEEGYDHGHEKGYEKGYDDGYER